MEAILRYFFKNIISSNFVKIVVSKLLEIKLKLTTKYIIRGENIVRKFDDEFIFGAATASFQIEGAWDEDGKGLSIWDVFCRIPGKVSNKDNGDIACDHYHRVDEDIKIMKTRTIQKFDCFCILNTREIKYTFL